MQRPHAGLIADYNAYFAGMRGVVSVGIGQDAEGAPVLDVLVDPATYDPRLIPPVFNGYPVRITFSPPARLAHAPHFDRVRPLRPGVSINPDGLFPGFAGTLGGLVTHQDRAYVVSNNHVLASNNPAAIGQPVYQPAGRDGGTLADAVATVVHFDPLDIGVLNRLDIAVAEVTLPGPVNPIPLDFFVQPLEVFRIPIVGETVRKSGRTTGLTSGLVGDTDALVNITYPPPIGVLTFVGTVLVSGASFMAGGDSGSWTYDSAMNMVGMGFAVNGAGTAWLINPLDIKAYLEAVIVGPPPPPAGESSILAPALAFAALGLLGLIMAGDQKPR